MIATYDYVGNYTRQMNEQEGRASYWMDCIERDVAFFGTPGLPPSQAHVYSHKDKMIYSFKQLEKAEKAVSFYLHLVKCAKEQARRERHLKHERSCAASLVRQLEKPNKAEFDHEERQAARWTCLLMSELSITHWQQLLWTELETKAYASPGLCKCGNEYADSWCDNCEANGDEQEADDPNWRQTVGVGL
jgi:hypothetical protein